MSILPPNGNERAWSEFSARSRSEATAITIGHAHEAFPCSAADGDLDFSSDERAADLRRENGRAVREIGARVCREAIPKQNQSCVEQRCRCGAAAQAHARVLWLLRLAFLSARTLAPREAAAHIPKRAVW